MADRDSLAIIIVTYNSVQEIDACLHSLVGHTSPFPTTITVVDNASPDGTAAHVRNALALRAGDRLRAAILDLPRRTTSAFARRRATTCC